MTHATPRFESGFSPILQAVAAMGPGPLTERGLISHIHPLFSRVLERREIYLANHSLGRPLDQTAIDVRSALDCWYADMDGAWGLWLDEQSRFRAGIARLIGLSRSDGVVPKASAGQGLRAVLNALNTQTSNSQCRVLATTGEFDSIDFIMKSYAQAGCIEMDWVRPDASGRFSGHAIAEHIKPGTRLVEVSQVMFNTGQIVPDLEAVVRAAHAVGALVLIDAYHAAGVLPISMEALGADFMIGGSYKYTRGGPGACWLAIHPRHLEGDQTLTTLDTGWFAQRDVFGFERSHGEVPPRAAGGDAWLESTPPILSPFQARAGLDLTLALGVDRLRDYSLGQLRLFQSMLERQRIKVLDLAEHERGAFLTIPHANPASAVRALKEVSINVDARAAGVRFCPDILTTTSELERASETIGRVMIRR